MHEPLSILKALADGSRLRVAAALMEHEELCVCQITELLQLATATVSRHMSILQNAHVVQSRKIGRWVYYRLTDEFPELLRQWLTRDLAESPQILQDRKDLTTILSYDPEELCRMQKKRSHCDTQE
ncbi:MAG: metalloregulator ArsR/SmtB family transcription factor [Desulfohalobiaceae bacterium]|nr:metalloregulator ArsR/SmtB family transcription factor [Desulfohalobiaceae bacterium]